MQIPLWTNKKILEGGEPIFLKGKQNKVGVLLIHGWSSTPQELRNTADYLNNLGYPVYAPLLRGHGTEPRDLIGLKWEDWLEDVCQAYDYFSKHVDEIVVGGMSAGAILALHLSLKRKVKAVITMGVPLIFRRNFFIKLLLRLFGKRTNYIMTKPYFSESDRAISKRKVHYFQFPLKSLYEVIRAISATTKILSQITVPILIMHSDPDKRIPSQSSRILYDKIRSKPKKLFFIKDSYHVFTVDKHADKAHRIIGEFLNEIAKSQIPSTKYQ